MNVDLEPKDIDLLIRAIGIEKTRVQQADTSAKLKRASIVAIDSVAEKLKQAKDAHDADGNKLPRAPRWQFH